MANNDKVLVLFLVSMGFFSYCSAEKYVSGLGEIQKSALYGVTQNSAANVDNDTHGDPGGLTQKSRNS